MGTIVTSYGQKLSQTFAVTEWETCRITAVQARDLVHERRRTDQLRAEMEKVYELIRSEAAKGCTGATISHDPTVSLWRALMEPCILYKVHGVLRSDGFEINFTPQTADGFGSTDIIWRG